MNGLAQALRIAGQVVVFVAAPAVVCGVGVFLILERFVSDPTLTDGRVAELADEAESWLSALWPQEHGG